MNRTARRAMIRLSPCEVLAMTQTDILAAFSDGLTDTLPAVGESGFSAALVALLRRLVPIDDATVVLYPAQGLPLIEYSEVPETTGASTLERLSSRLGRRAPASTPSTCPISCASSPIPRRPFSSR